MPNSPAIHIHLDSDTFQFARNGIASPNEQPDLGEPSSHPKWKRSLISVADEDEDDSASDIKPITIKDVLNNLHQVMPALDFPQYRDALESHGIHYARSILDFDRNYFEKTIKMADGAIGEFTQSVKRAVQKQRKERIKLKKRGRVAAKENEPVIIL